VKGSGLRAESVTALRASRGLSQADLASAVGVSRQQINRIERGHADPHLSTVRALSQALGVPLADLVDE
jgi:putative transcriptional regulator